jgi:hypothetical protein
MIFPIQLERTEPRSRDSWEFTRVIAQLSPLGDGADMVSEMYQMRRTFPDVNADAFVNVRCAWHWPFSAERTERN